MSTYISISIPIYYCMSLSIFISLYCCNCACVCVCMTLLYMVMSMNACKLFTGYACARMAVRYIADLASMSLSQPAEPSQRPRPLLISAFTVDRALYFQSRHTTLPGP